MVNPEKLYKELIAAGIVDVANCNSAGEVWIADGTRIQARADVTEVIAVHDPTPINPTEQVFDLPLRAPIVTASDFIVQSPKPKANHLEAHAEAIAESLKKDKSLALIVLDLVVYITELENRLKKKGI